MENNYTDCMSYAYEYTSSIYSNVTPFIINFERDLTPTLLTMSRIMLCITKSMIEKRVLNVGILYLRCMRGVT